MTGDITNAEARAHEVLAKEYERATDSGWESTRFHAANVRVIGRRDYADWKDRAAIRAMLAFANTDGSTEGEAEPFQARVEPWLMACFGAEIAADSEERNHRFLEEALELVQSTGCTASEAHQLVDYVFGRPVGEPAQEVGGAMVTLAALCLAKGLDMHDAAEIELARIWTKVEAIRAKQAAKPKHSPLPQHSGTPRPVEPTAESHDAGYRAGIEAAAKVAESTRPTPEEYGLDALYAFERARHDIASAIRALASSPVQTDEVQP